MRRAGLVLIALLLLACSDDDPGRGSGTTERSTTTEPTPSALALRGDGLGVVGLGASPDDAIAAVSAELGEPSVDTGWEPSAASHATCPGDRIRRVEWGGLILLFTDGKTDHGDGEHLFTWRVTGAPPPVATAEGLGYGATLRDAEQLYDDEVERVPAEEPFPSFLRISGGGGEITAYLDDTDTITNLEAGTGCGE